MKATLTKIDTGTPEFMELKETLQRLYPNGEDLLQMLMDLMLAFVIAGEVKGINNVHNTAQLWSVVTDKVRDALAQETLH